MRQLKVTSFAELMDGHQSAEIVCPMKGDVVRRLVVRDGMVEIDAISEEAIVEIGTTIFYEPWCMDRGSMVFESKHAIGMLKICTEMDIIRFPDGDEAQIVP